jgi:hypothetical protein
MSTELKTRSTAYNLTRVALRGVGVVGVIVHSDHKFGETTLDKHDICAMFYGNDWRRVGFLDIPPESLTLLKLDLAEFALTGGDAMY